MRLSSSQRMSHSEIPDLKLDSSAPGFAFLIGILSSVFRFPHHDVPFRFFSSLWICVMGPTPYGIAGSAWLDSGFFSVASVSKIRIRFMSDGSAF